MAASIILYDRNTEAMRPVARYLQMLKEARDGLVAQRAVMLGYRDNDGSSAADYDLLAVAGDFRIGDYASANAAAKASFEEIDSLTYKLTTNASVTDVLAALDQCCAKHGVVT